MTEIGKVKINRYYHLFVSGTLIWGHFLDPRQSTILYFEKIKT